MYATGCPTQFSVPSIFTSTLPLDFGGYDRGILDRPVSFVEILAERGYHCMGVATGPWEAKAFGYSRGFHQFYHTFDLRGFVGPLLNEIYLQYYQNIAKNNPTLKEHVAAKRKEFLLLCLSFIKEELRLRISDTLPKWIYPKSYSKEILSKYLRLIENAMVEIERGIDVLNYTVADLPPKRDQHSFVQRAIMILANRYFPNTIINDDEMFPTLFSKELLNCFAEYFFSVAQNFPVFQYMHLLDIHELKYTNRSFQLNNKLFLSNSLYEDINFCLYEAAIENIDKNIGNYLEKLFSQGYGEDLSVIISGDHGHHFGYPNRQSLNQIESSKVDIYHESLDTVMLFYSPKLKQMTFSNHCSLLDLAPSLLDMMGMKKENSFKGHSIFAPWQNEVVISESCGKGPGDLFSKPIYLSIKKSPYKLIYKEFLTSDDPIRNKMELYSLEDRFDQNNLIHNRKYKSVQDDLEKIAKERIRKIRNDMRN